MANYYCQLTKRLYEALGHVLDVLDCENSNHIPPDKEGILLPYGDHVISVKLEGKPKAVYVSLHDEGVATCGGEISMVGTTLLEDGFVLYTHIRSNEAVVRWIVQLV